MNDGTNSIATIASLILIRNIEMKNRSKFCNTMMSFYFEGKDGERVYTGSEPWEGWSGYMSPAADMINSISEIKEEDGEVYLPVLVNKSECEICEGYGMWPDQDIPISEIEKTWCLGDTCLRCGSNNYDSYDSIEDDAPWSKTTSSSHSSARIDSIGFYNAIKNFRRNMGCAELSVTQEEKERPW